MFNNFPNEMKFIKSNSCPPLIHTSQKPGLLLNYNYIDEQSQKRSRSLSSFQFPQSNEIPSENNKQNMISGENENNIENKGIIKFIQNSKGLTINKNIFNEDHIIEGKVNDFREKKENPNLENSKNSTNTTLKQKIFHVVYESNDNKKHYTRIDYLLKAFKTNFSSFIKIQVNNKLQASLLPEDFKKLEISSPNSIDFSSNVTIKDNYIFLSFTVQEIFCYYKKNNSRNRNQKKNKKVIEKILNYIEGKNEKKFEKILSFLKMSLEDAYINFYDSIIFFQYARDENTIIGDKEFKAIYGFSLLEKYGFIKLLKTNYKEAKHNHITKRIFFSSNHIE